MKTVAGMVSGALAVPLITANGETKHLMVKRENVWRETI